MPLLCCKGPFFSINKAISSREEYHQENCKNLQDKDRYRKQLRETGEHSDELQVQLFRSQGEILALQAKLRRQNHFHKTLGVSSHVIYRIQIFCTFHKGKSLFCSHHFETLHISTHTSVMSQ